ncbi:hypothetical protein BDD12DRAFT_910669 [Trichophaea hybrida]|nr:hypothetical protein BDD12DRAFT_910669 [Trichophaea hybrida]
MFDPSPSPSPTWASTLASLPPPTDLGPNTPWWQLHPRPRFTSYRPTIPPSQPRRRRRRRRKYRPPLCTIDNTPLTLSRALTTIKLLTLGHYSGPFPITNAEFFRIQEFRDAESRGRSPVRRPREWCATGEWRKQEIVGVKEREGMNALLRHWGWDGRDVGWNWQFSGAVEGLLKMLDEGEEEKGSEGSGYSGCSEEQGGKEGGLWGWGDGVEENEDEVYPVFPERSREEGFADEEDGTLEEEEEEEEEEGEEKEKEKEDGERYVYLTPDLRLVRASPIRNWELEMPLV